MADVRITKAEADFMGHVWGQVYAEDVKYGSAKAMLPLMIRLANVLIDFVDDGVATFDASVDGMGISPTDAYGPLKVYDPSGFITPDEADALADRLEAAARAPIPAA